MFQIAIDDVSVILDKVLISGKCVNEKEFTSKLIDNDCTVYTAMIPFIKYVVLPEPNYMTLELKNISDPNTLKGRTLKSIPQ